jgi:hypothetical protein
MLANESWAQRGKPLVMDAFKNGVYSFHMGQIAVTARCAYTQVVGSDIAKPMIGKCSDHHGAFELPGDTVSAFRWEGGSTRGTTRNDTTYETFPNGDLEVNELHSWDCIDGLPQCSHYRMIIYHFSVVEMKQQNRVGN